MEQPRRLVVSAFGQELQHAKSMRGPALAKIYLDGVAAPAVGCAHRDEIDAEATERTELLELWGQSGSTVVFVTHNPMEAVFLADRVIIMTPGPGRISEELSIGTSLPRPRDFEDQRLWELSREAVRRLVGEDVGEAKADRDPQLHAR